MKARQIAHPDRAPDSGAPATLGDALRREMEWLAAVIDARIRQYFSGDAAGGDPAALPPPTLGSSRYADLIRRTRAGAAERLLLALAVAPHVAPHVLDVFFLKNEKTDRGFTEFGGVKGVHHAGFIPTGETALFLLCGADIGRRLAAGRLLDEDHPLHASGALRLGPPHPDEPAWSGPLTFSASLLRHLATGEDQRPEMGSAFPARPISTPLAWGDLVLDEETLSEVAEIKAWARHSRELLDDWGLARQLRPGFRALFHGPSGTGKTLTASLIGKELGVEVYRLDLSQVVSKYIGETEKNLASVFSEAQKRSWILFFDEADALFGKRTQTASAHDRYANQEVAYLLQRVEEHPGIVILASNLKANLDDAFARRFQATIYFAPPSAGQRLRLWRNGFGSRVRLGPNVELESIARAHELTGGQIINIVRHSCLKAVQRADKQVALADILQGIRREHRKEGRDV
jgi:hypothetical protein